MLSRADTQQYPEVQPELPARSRGVIALVEENCTVCMLCARECPDWCIYIDSHKETAPAPEGGRPRAHNVLDRFAIDFSLCMYCGICIEVCPFDALFWSPEFEYAEYDIRNLLHEKDKLGEWVQTVPIPPAHEPNAEPPKEIDAASRGAARPTRDRPAPGTPPAAATPATPVPPPSATRPGATPPGTASPGTTPPGTASPGTTPPGTASPGTTPAGTTPPEGTSEGTPPAATAGGTAPSRASSSGRTPHAAVRAIRPPGALPKKTPPDPGNSSSPSESSGSPGAVKPTKSSSSPESGSVEES